MRSTALKPSCWALCTEANVSRKLSNQVVGSKVRSLMGFSDSKNEGGALSRFYTVLYAVQEDFREDRYACSRRIYMALIQLTRMCGSKNYAPHTESKGANHRRVRGSVR